MPEMMGVEDNHRTSEAALDLQRLAEQKEQEWRHVQQLRMESLGAALKLKERELQEERSKFNKLKEDFKYNLKLLNDRHIELEKYDTVVADVKNQLATKDREISELHVRMDEVQTVVQREIKSKNEMQDHYQRRIREKQTELEHYRVEKDAEINREREDVEEVKRSLERQLREVEEELDVQRQELSLGYEEAMHRREHEFRVQMDELRGVVHSHELKTKVLQKELEQVRVLQQKSTEECVQTSEQQKKVEKQLKQAHWEITDVTAMKDAKIHELEAKLDHEEKVTKRLREEFKRKHDELDGLVREKEATISKVRNAGLEREQMLQNTVRNLNKTVEDLKGSLRQSQWKQEDSEKENEVTIERLNDELNDVKRRLETCLSELSHGNHGKQSELESLRENEIRLRAELVQRKQDIERYQKDLVAATERQNSLERAKAQIELDWQRRHEGLERTQFEKSEDLVKSLTKSRDEAVAEIKELKREIKQSEDLINVLRTDRDNAIATLKLNSLKIDHNAQVNGYGLEESSEVRSLQQQNDNLRAVIAQMREEMEELGAQFPSNQPVRGKNDSVTIEYVKNLEKEIRSLKSKNRELEEVATDGGMASMAQVENKALERAGNNMVVKAHVEQLNGVIGSLRTEKVQLATQLRKMQTRLYHVETNSDQTAKHALQRQSELEQTQYELSAAHRRHTAEVQGLHQRIVDLELQLSEARKEADEYYKATIERNLEVTSLGNELSSLKLEISQKRQPINFGAQELLIQQLEDEISQLRKQDRNEVNVTAFQQMGKNEGGNSAGTSATVIHLQNKLKQAARHISQLAREKQQLIEVGNRQRAQLLQAGLRPTSPFSQRPTIRPPSNAEAGRSGSQLQDKIHSKLQQLESLQYQLTKQRLTQQNDFKQAWFDTESSETTTSSEKEEIVPPSILKNNSASQPPPLSPVPENHQSSAQHVAERIAQRPTTAGSEVSARDQGVSERRAQLGQVMMSMSSAGGESLQEIWRMLDEDGVSPRITPTNTLQGPFVGLQFPGETPWRDGGKEAGGSPSSSGSWTLRGAQAPVAKQPEKQLKKYQPQRSVGKPSKTQQRPKIRNYNVKDGKQTR